jgi:hypothetical protein
VSRVPGPERLGGSTEGSGEGGLRRLELLVKRIGCLAAAPESLIGEVAERLQRVSLDAGQPIFKAGAPASNLYIVDSGQVWPSRPGPPCTIASQAFGGVHQASAGGINGEPISSTGALGGVWRGAGVTPAAG